MASIPARLVVLLMLLSAAACTRDDPMSTPQPPSQPAQTGKTETATFGAGCFWCVEAVFQRVEGVLSVKSGYAGGTAANPSYEDVCRGDTGHAEVVRIEFDPAKVSYETLLDVFWKAHDPTTPNRQGADEGAQYRSIILYHSEAQKEAAEAAKAALEKSGRYRDPIVTQIAPAGAFYPAELYHQNYYNRNRTVPYCRLVIEPKLEKLKMPP